MKIAVLIMAGGNGTRLWPISNKDFPKQFHNLICEDKSMIATIFEIAKSITSVENIFISANRSHLGLVQDALPKMVYDNIISESHFVGTMASIAMANLHVRSKVGDAIVLVLSSDCVLGNLPNFQESIRVVCAQAECEDRIVSLGIKPTEAHTGYGYMKCGVPFDSMQAAFECDGYVEKPPRKLAEKFVKSGFYLWNTGIFAWHTSVLSRAISQYAVELAEDYALMEEAYFNADFNISLIDSIYSKMHPISFDHAIMERIDRGDPIKSILVDGCFDWEDIGSYNALKNHLKHDLHGNAFFGSVMVDPSNAPQNSILICQPPYHMMVSGNLDKTIISISSTGNILIIPVSQEQEIKKILNDDNVDAMQSGIHRISNPITGKKIVLHNVDSLNLNATLVGDVRASNMKNINLSVDEFKVHINA